MPDELTNVSQFIFPPKKCPEYGYDDDEYGHSVDDDAPISPTDAKQWLFDRERGQQSMSSFIANHRDIEEEDEDQCDVHDSNRRKSEVNGEVDAIFASVRLLFFFVLVIRNAAAVR